MNALCATCGIFSAASECVIAKADAPRIKLFAARGGQEGTEETLSLFLSASVERHQTISPHGCSIRCALKRVRLESVRSLSVARIIDSVSRGLASAVTILYLFNDVCYRRSPPRASPLIPDA